MLNVSRVNRPLHLLKGDIFHTLSGVSTGKLVVLMFVIYFLVYLFYGLITWSPLIPKKTCNIEHDLSLHQAIFIALETITSIGYGVKDPYFNGCWQMFVLIT